MSDPTRAPSGLLSRRDLILVAAVFMALVALAIVFDGPVSQYAQALPDPVRWVFGMLTYLGASEPYLLPSAALCLVSLGLARVSPRLVSRLALLQMAGLYAFVFFSVGVPVALGYVVKRLLGRARPEFYDTLGSRSFFGPGADWNYESFPSTHTATAFGVAMMIGYLWPRWFGPALVLALLVGVSRIVLGVHYPSDVLGGFVFGVAGAALVRLVFVRLGWVFRRLDGDRIVMRRLSAVQRLVRRPEARRKAVPKQ